MVEVVDLSGSGNSNSEEPLSGDEIENLNPVGEFVLTNEIAVVSTAPRPPLQELPVPDRVPAPGGRLTMEEFKVTEKGQQQSKGWVFTWNNPTAYCKLALQRNLTEPVLNIKFMIWSFEIGEQGTPHFQGYVKFHRKKRCYLVMRDVLGVWIADGWPHIEPAKGGEYYNFEYCSKNPRKWVPEDRPYIRMIGEPEDDRKKSGNQGKRNDIAAFQEYVVKNPFEDEIELAIKFPLIYNQCHTAFKKFVNLCQARWIKKNFYSTSRSRGVKVYWFWGPSNAGKTYEIKRRTKNQDVYWKNMVKWWPGYRGEGVIVIDDARPAMFPMWRLLMLLDSTIFQVEYKGSDAYIMAHTIYISCPWHPRDFYRSTDDDCQQVVNRILNRETPGEIIEFPARPLRVAPGTQHRPVSGGGHFTPTRRESRGPAPRTPPTPYVPATVCQCNNLVCMC